MPSTRRNGHLGRLLIRLVINAVALYIATLVVPGVRFLNPYDWPTVILVAILFGLVNALIRPLAMVLTCLINMITLGLFTLVVNAFMLWLTATVASRLGLGFQVEGFVPAFFGALVISLVSFVLTRLLE